MGLGLIPQEISQHPVRASVKILAIRDVTGSMLIKEPVHAHRLGGFNDVPEMLLIVQLIEITPDGAALCAGQLHRIGQYLVTGLFSIYHNKGMRWMCANGIPQNSVNGVVSKEALSEEDAAHLIETNLLIKSEAGFSLNFPHFTAEQFRKFVSLFEMTDKKLNDLLAEWIVTVRNNFENFVPKHLHDQINQWVSCYLHQIIGYVTDELIRRGILRKPDNEKPLTDGVFIVEGKYINP